MVAPSNLVDGVWKGRLFRWWRKARNELEHNEIDFAPKLRINRDDGGVSLDLLRMNDSGITVWVEETNVVSPVFAGCYSDSVHHGWAPPCGFYNARPRRTPTYFSGVASTFKLSCPPGAPTELFNSSAFSRPAVKASCPVAKP